MFTVDKPFLRTEFNYSMEEASAATGLQCLDPSRTVQDQTEEVDINTIVRRFGLTGQLPDAVAMPQYRDFEEVIDYHSAMIAVTKAQDSFMQMPAEVRARFGNDPQVFLEFCGDPGNLEEARKLGLAPPGSPPAEPADPPKGD